MRQVRLVLQVQVHQVRQLRQVRLTVVVQLTDACR
jgi:hypothetical protein